MSLVSFIFLITYYNLKKGLKMIENYHLETSDMLAPEAEQLFLDGLSHEAKLAKGLAPIDTFGIAIKDSKGVVVGGASGVFFYGCLYVDMLWIDAPLRHKGWGTKLIAEAERLARSRRCRFSTLNTMDWEALPFYRKQGYEVEFTREGYDKGSKMYLLRKELT
jgi:GNAT superfamily N-acetyltransferase